MDYIKLAELINKYEDSEFFGWWYALRLWVAFGSVQRAYTLHLQHKTVQEHAVKTSWTPVGTSTGRMRSDVPNLTASSSFTRKEREKEAKERRSYNKRTRTADNYTSRSSYDNDDDDLGSAIVTTAIIDSMLDSSNNSSSSSNDEPFGGGGDFAGGGAGGNWDTNDTYS